MTMKLETKVGAFFILAIAVLGTLIVRMEKLDIFGGRSENKLVTEFDQVAGLSLQSAIALLQYPSWLRPSGGMLLSP